MGLHIADDFSILDFPALQAAQVVFRFRVNRDPGKQLLQQSPARSFERFGRTLEAFQEQGANQRDNLFLAAFIERLISGVILIAFPISQRVINTQDEQWFVFAERLGYAIQQFSVGGFEVVSRDFWWLPFRE